jgi:hypothetical protein
VTDFVSSSAYDPLTWQGFAIAEVGAAAALAGLLVVAASINIREIIQLPAVVSRLAATLSLFAAILFVGTVLLIPDQSRALLGIEIAVIGAALGVVVWSERSPDADPENGRRTLIMSLVALAAAVLMTIAGIAVAGMFGGGLYWLAPGVVLAFAVGLANAWAALIEVVR